ncbi:hypothetical protein PALB_20190 [Pseudoalteromonas luteoviolacea B = ATCC 29581]|nr:hypothetical protein PALB_20190 [Pseudoalteromonas luteoviolacea B = ATCC 29581]
MNDYVEINEQHQLQDIVSKYQLFAEIEQCVHSTEQPASSEKP